MAGRVANGSVSRFPPAQSRNRRRSREDRGAKTSGDESDHNSRARRNRRREERMRAVMTDTEAVIKNQQNQPHHRYAIFLALWVKISNKYIGRNTLSENIILDFFVS